MVFDLGLRQLRMKVVKRSEEQQNSSSLWLKNIFSKSISGTRQLDALAKYLAHELSA